MQELDNHLSYVLYVINKHGVSKLFFVFAVTSLVRQIFSLETLDSCLIAIWGANELGDEDVVKLLQVVLNPFV